MQGLQRSFGTLAALIALLSCTLAQPDTSAQTEPNPLLEESRALTAEFGQRLRTELMQAMAEGGPAAAIDVCRNVAPQIASELSRRSGAGVSRTSRRYRNPGNAPAPWQTEVLEQFPATPRADTADVPEYFADSAGEARYMRAIFADGLCLTCHGETLPEEVAAALDEHYPHDLATGYGPGELRGAFVVVWPAATREAATID